MPILKNGSRTLADMRAEAAERQAAEAREASLNAEELLVEALARIETLEAAKEGK